MPSRTPESSHHVTSWALWNKRFWHLTWCDTFWPNLRLEVTSGDGCFWRKWGSNLFEGLIFLPACSVRFVCCPFCAISAESQRSRPNRWRTNSTEHASKKIRSSKRLELHSLQNAGCPKWHKLCKCCNTLCDNFETHFATTLRHFAPTYVQQVPRALDRKPRRNVTAQWVRPVCDTLFPEPLPGKSLYGGPE